MNTSCFVCGKLNLNKNETALNKKLLGRDIKKYFCLECLAEYLEVTTDILIERAEEFKKMGCGLF